MHRTRLLDLLNQYTPINNEEKSMRDNTVAFVETEKDCFERSLQVGHITGSAWILDSTRSRALLMHHRKLERWFQPGGHCDGEADVQRVAFREATEETQIRVKPADNQIFDIDIHPIPARGDEPEHLHYDIRFLFEALPNQTIGTGNAEAKNLAWVELAEVTQYNNSPSIMRMVEKSYRTSTENFT